MLRLFFVAEPSRDHDGGMAPADEAGKGAENEDSEGEGALLVRKTMRGSVTMVVEKINKK
jgi:hypothetical protein